LEIYITVYTDTQKELRKIETVLRSILEARLVYIRPALFRQKEGFVSCNPYCLDQLIVHTTMNTAPLSSIFPFVSSDLTSDDGIMYGLNRHNNSLIIFDRFKMENANQVVFAKSGAGKSYAVKLDALRSIMMGTDVIIIDPEQEYKHLSDAVGGTYINISLSSKSKINPF